MAAALPAPVPQEYQFEHGELNACGPYAAIMVLNYWRPGQSCEARAAQEIKWRLPGCTPFSGATPPFSLAAYLRKNGLAVANRSQGCLEDLRNQIALGHPVIVLVHPAERPWYARHYRVVVAYDDTAGVFHFNDPACLPQSRGVPGNLSIPYSVFEGEWNGGGFWRLWQRWYLAAFVL